MQHILILFVPGVIGGAINAIAGGGGIIMYPALLASGLSPIVANATASLVVWPGGLTSAFAYRKELRKVPRTFLWLLIPCLLGAMIGSRILIHTKPLTFEKLAPWLVFSAVILLALQSRLHLWLSNQAKKRKIRWHTIPLLCLATFPLAIYGGYFGVGFGLMMLAFLGFTQLKNIYQINAVKSLSGACITLVSTIYFSQAGLTNWSTGIVMAVGTITGGWLGAHLSQKVSAHLVHNVTVVIGLIIAIVLFVKS